MENNINFVCPIFLSGIEAQKVLDKGEKFVYDMFKTIRETHPELCRRGKKIRSTLIAEYFVDNLDPEEVSKFLREMGIQYQKNYPEK